MSGNIQWAVHVDSEMMRQGEGKIIDYNGNIAEGEYKDNILI